MQTYRIFIFFAIISLVFGSDIINDQLCSLYSDFNYLNSLVTIKMMNVTDFSDYPHWNYLNDFDKKIYEVVIRPAFCSKVLGLPSNVICNLNEYIVTEAIQLHVDNENYNVFVSLIVNIGIRMIRNGFSGSIINVFNDILRNILKN